MWVFWKDKALCQRASYQIVFVGVKLSVALFVCPSWFYYVRFVLCTRHSDRLDTL